MAIREITPEELSKLRVKEGKKSELRQAAEALKPGGIVRIDMADYPYPKGPRQLIWRLNRKSGRKYSWHRIRDGSGFVVERIL